MAIMIRLLAFLGLLNIPQAVQNNETKSPLNRRKKPAIINP